MRNDLVSAASHRYEVRKIGVSAYTFGRDISSIFSRLSLAARWTRSSALLGVREIRDFDLSSTERPSEVLCRILQNIETASVSRNLRPNLSHVSMPCPQYDFHVQEILKRIVDIRTVTSLRVSPVFDQVDSHPEKPCFAPETFKILECDEFNGRLTLLDLRCVERQEEIQLEIGNLLRACTPRRSGASSFKFL